MANITASVVIDNFLGDPGGQFDITLYDGETLIVAQTVGRAEMEACRIGPDPFNTPYAQFILAETVQAAGCAFDGSSDAGMIATCEATPVNVF